MTISKAKSTGLFQPLRSSTFRNLLVANLVSDIGTFAQSVGAAWLMVSLNAGPMYVALTSTASALPYFLLALPAGALGDIVDRRKLILTTETWMTCVAVVLAGMTIAGWMSPALLLILTFLLSAGDAFESPSWRSILPELVRKEDLPAAAALNGIEFNIARAVGPAFGGFLIAIAGIGAAFVLNTVSFLGVILVILRWKQPAAKRTTPPETVTGATVAALRYVRYSPAVRVVLIRAGAAMFFASGLLALLPSVARQVSRSPVGYGALLGCFGFGAVLGALAMQRARVRFSVDQIVSVGIATFSLTTIAAGMLPSLIVLGAVMLAGGAAWVSFISLFNVQILNQAPDWVRARVQAVSMLVFQGAVAAGSATWGAVAGRAGLGHALLGAGIGMMGAAALGLFLRLPDVTVDLTPWNHWRLPDIAEASAEASPGAEGPVLVTAEYQVDPQRVSEFIKAIHEYERIRRRDGASRWGVGQDLEHPHRYLETFIVSSWAEHLRQHERFTRADSHVEERLLSCVVGEPTVHHYQYL